jgi:release factor H-coupled RctB family protein
MIHPYLIGGDIGCGMALFKTDLVQRDIKLNRWADLRFDLEHLWEGAVGEVLAASELESTAFDGALGTLGGGNHFAELQMVDEVLETRALKRVGLGKQQLVVLVHSGSRGLGESILRTYVEEHQASGSDAESFTAAAYLRDHDLAVRWAKTNRALIARRFIEALGAEAQCLWDGCHNSITRREFEGEVVWVHRRGAVATEGEPVMIPGSRGSLSYLVKPLGDGESHAWSLAHGAGRKWARSETRLRMRERFGMHQLTQTPLGGRVICGERDLLYEEAPAAYKNIEDVIQDLVDAELVSVIATFRPLLTYKTRAFRR